MTSPEDSASTFVQNVRLYVRCLPSILQHNAFVHQRQEACLSAWAGLRACALCSEEGLQSRDGAAQDESVDVVGACSTQTQLYVGRQFQA